MIISTAPEKPSVQNVTLSDADNEHLPNVTVFFQVSQKSNN